MLERDFDLKRIIKKLRVHSVQLKMLLERSQQKFCKHIAKQIIRQRHDSSGSSTDDQEPLRKGHFDWLNDVLENIYDENNHRLLQLFIN